MRRPTAALSLFLLAACGGGGSGADARDVGSGLEGLRFPDTARSERGRDAPGPALEASLLDRALDQPRAPDAPLDLRSWERSRDLPRGELPMPPDLAKGDLWTGGPCFYDWASWTCQNSSSTCTAGCGIATITCQTVWTFSICTCTVNGVAKQCGTVTGSTCGRCQNAFKSGCCVPP